MTKQYTITKEESYTEFFVDEGKVEGTLYHVTLDNGDTSEDHKYFVRNDKASSDVLINAVNALEKSVEEDKTAAELATPVTVE